MGTRLSDGCERAEEGSSGVESVLDSRQGFGSAPVAQAYNMDERDLPAPHGFSAPARCPWSRHTHRRPASSSV